MYIVDFVEYLRSGTIDCLEYILTQIRVGKFDVNKTNQHFSVNDDGSIRVGSTFLAYSNDNGFFFSSEPFYWKFVPHSSHPDGMYIELDGFRVYNDRGSLVLIRPGDTMHGTVWIVGEPNKKIS